MKITLKQWLEISTSIKAAGEALNSATDLVTKMALDQHDAGNATEATLLMEISQQLHDIMLPSGTNPQSEWTGGDSSDPKNHKLREPNIVGGCSSKRYFTEEEMIEAGAVNLGPCQWKYMTPDEMAQACVDKGHDIGAVAGWPDSKRWRIINGDTR